MEHASCILGQDKILLTLHVLSSYNITMKKQTITPDMIKEATILYVSEYGLENVTTKKVALSMGISEGSIFHNFPNKKALLTECLCHIDRQIDEVLKTVPINGLKITKTIRNLWFAYFDYLTRHKSYAKFYRQFRQSSYYTDEVKELQSQSFTFFSRFLKNHAKYFGFDPNFYWVFLLETTLNFAVHVADGELPGTPRDVERIYRLVSHGFLGSLNFMRKD